MAHLGILEGAGMSPSSPRRAPFGTLASSRYRRSVGPALLGASEADISPDYIAKAKAAAQVAAANAAAMTTGPGKGGAAMNAGTAAYKELIDAEIMRLSNLQAGTVPLPFENTPSSGTKSQDELRTYYNVQSEGAATPMPSASAVPANVTQEDLRNPGAPASEASPGKSLLVPIAALAAAYFFLKG